MRPFAASADAQAISDWVVEQGLLRGDPAALLYGYCERLVAVGLPLLRGHFAARTIHPRFSGFSCTWRRGEGVVHDSFEHTSAPVPRWRNSPLFYLIERRERLLRRRLDLPGAVDEFPIFAELRALGATEYVAMLTPFGMDGKVGGDSGVVASWVSDAANGFDDGHLALLLRLQPRFATAVQTRLDYDIAVNLLNTYTGPDAGRRILSGEIQRGSVTATDAVIWYADLRGFTTYAADAPREELVPTLNAYFDCMVPPLAARGGQVLAYLGDGLLATFDLSQEGACPDALAAAQEALARTAAHNAQRGANGLPTLDLDVALHRGEVLYGNVGAADRLSFTVTGPAVNEASRMEGLCEQVGRSLVMSKAFADTCGVRVASLGHHALRGVARPQELFGLAE